MVFWLWRQVISTRRLQSLKRGHFLNNAISKSYATPELLGFSKLLSSFRANDASANANASADYNLPAVAQRPALTTVGVLPHQSARAFSGVRKDDESALEEGADEGPVIAVDRSGLQNMNEHSHDVHPHKEPETPVAKHIKTLIRFRGGPITVAEFMSEALTNPAGGFYMSRDVFGAGGDFVTSPEVSQVFGELIGVWSVCLWHKMGCPEKVQLVELGPGRGTLMADLLRGTATFQEFAKSAQVHFVELSPALRAIQRKTLQCHGSLEEAPSDQRLDSGIEGDPGVERAGLQSALSGASVQWHATLEEVPRGPTIFIAHEFLDALPVHQFQRTQRGWCERLVDLAEDSSPEHLRFVLSKTVTPAVALLLRKRLSWLTSEQQASYLSLEVCPGALRLAADIARRVAEDGGGALMIDYGDDGPVKDSLQAIKKHKFVPLLSEPGSADLSAYVDFAAVRHSVEEANVEAQAYGPITQAEFLAALGINLRVEALLRNATEAQAEALEQGYMRLVGDGPGDKDTPPGMGKRYKALAITRTNYGPPVAFS